MPGIPVRGVVLAALTVFVVGCSDASDGSGGGTSLAADACTKARVALAAGEQEGLSKRVYDLVEDFLGAAMSADDPTLLFQAMQVADAHRGSDPALTLVPSLQNMARFCDQGPS
jgi:hypothetical protein